MAEYKWYKEEVPKGLKVKQVYGIVFSDDGKIILRIEDNKYKLTGGKPEDIDIDYKSTLEREYLEELNIEIDEIHYLGYLLVSENNEEYAQVRMIGKIKNIGDIKPDKDNGKIYKRFMANQSKVKKYLKYEDLDGNQMIDDALILGNDIYKFRSKDEKEYYV